MGALADAATFVEDPTVVAPLTVALVDHALGVIAEGSSVPGHDHRVSLATQTIYDPETWAKRLIWAVATDEDVVSAWVADDKETAMAALPAAIEAIWNANAGLTTS